MTLRRALVVINPKAGRGFGTRLAAKPEPTTDPDASTVAKTSPSARFLASPVVRVYEDAVRPMLVAHCFELDEVYAETRGDVYRACARDVEARLCPKDPAQTGLGVAQKRSALVRISWF